MVLWYYDILHIDRLGERPPLHPGLVLHVGHLHAETVAVHEDALLFGLLSVKALPHSDPLLKAVTPKCCNCY